MAIKEYTIKSLSEMCECVKAMGYVSGNNHRMIWFRGHADVFWQLLPTIMRNGYDPEREFNLIMQFILEAPTRRKNCPRSEEHARWLFLMQHYGLPTRLLDWTRSWLIASYFAVAHDLKRDSAVWCLFPYEFNSLEISDSSVSHPFSAAAQSIITPLFKKEERSDLNMAMVGECIDSRMFVQQSTFTLHGNEKPLETLPFCEKYLTKLVIPRECHDEFHVELRLAGMTRSYIYPDLTNLAQSLRAWDRTSSAEAEPELPKPPE